MIEDTPFPLMFFWLGKDGEEYVEFETLTDYEAYAENEEMTRLGY